VPYASENPKIDGEIQIFKNYGKLTLCQRSQIEATEQ